MSWSAKTPYIVFREGGLRPTQVEEGMLDKVEGTRQMVVYEPNKLLDKKQMERLWKEGMPIDANTSGWDDPDIWKHYSNCSADPWTKPRHLKLTYLAYERYKYHTGIWWLDESDGTCYFMMEEQVYDAIKRDLIKKGKIDADFGLILHGNTFLGIEPL